MRILVALAAACLLSVSCKKGKPAAKIKGISEEGGEAAREGKCPCDDIGCWKTATDQAQRRSFQAAFDASKAAVSLAGGLEAQVALIGFGIAEVSKALLDRELLDFISALAVGQAEVLERF